MKFFLALSLLFALLAGVFAQTTTSSTSTSVTTVTSATTNTNNTTVTNNNNVTETSNGEVVVINTSNRGAAEGVAPALINLGAIAVAVAAYAAF
jgi:TRAP-type C4-dicarboxylate transport system substrate-binding protein